MSNGKAQSEEMLKAEKEAVEALASGRLRGSELQDTTLAPAAAASAETTGREAVTAGTASALAPDDTSESDSEDVISTSDDDGDVSDDVTDDVRGKKTANEVECRMCLNTSKFRLGAQQHTLRR